MSKERIDDEGLSNISGGGTESMGSPDGEAVTPGGPGGSTGPGAEKQDPGGSVEGSEGSGNMNQN